MKTFDNINCLLTKIQVTHNSKTILVDAAILKIIKLIKKLDKKKNKVIFLGNGGSASIASHMAIDFLRSAKIPAISFNDASLLTCISNDFGYEYVFQKPIETLAQKGDILFAISSSGKSKNIINAVIAAEKKRCYLITLSGFKNNNPLRRKGAFNFYVPSNSYGDVEIIHLIICHCIVDKCARE